MKRSNSPNRRTNALLQERGATTRMAPAPAGNPEDIVPALDTRPQSEAAGRIGRTLTKSGTNWPRPKMVSVRNGKWVATGRAFAYRRTKPLPSPVVSSRLQPQVMLSNISVGAER
jgi:hypothetical protein